jgi:deazaflavin-dependent oxidoreductase (nitroreductase family)
METQVRRALTHGGIIDITTTGRRTGAPRRIEIVYHTIDDRIYITGMPRADRTRAWLLNLEADPRLTFHLKGTISADLPATARVVTDEAERRAVFEYVVTVWKGQDVDTMVRYSPLVEVTIEDLAA